MKRKAWYLILFFMLVLTACAKEQPEENPDQKHTQSLPFGGQTEQPEENSDQKHVLSLPLGGQTVEVAVDSHLSLHECPGLFLNPAGRAVQLEGVRWFHVMANEQDKDYFFTFSEQNTVEQLQNSVFEWMAIPKEMLPVARLYGPLTLLTYIGDDEDYYYLAKTHTSGYLDVASIIVDGEVNEFGNWGGGYAQVGLSRGYYGFSEDSRLLENALKDRITPFLQSPLTTVNSPLLLYEADNYSELPYRGTILDEAWVADVSWAKSQLLEHAQDYAYPEELVKRVRDESEAGVSQNDWAMTILETDPGAVIDARAQIYARMKAFGWDVSLDQVVVLLGKSGSTGEASLCSVWLEEDGKLVWWDGYHEYFYQDIQPAVSIVKKMFED